MTSEPTLAGAPRTGERRRYDAAAEALVGGACRACATVTWPRRAGCPRCGSADVAEHVLPRRGTLVTFTRVWVPVEGIEPPYTLGMVELGGAEIFGHLRDLPDTAKVPQPVEVRVAEGAHPPFWFVPCP